MQVLDRGEALAEVVIACLPPTRLKVQVVTDSEATRFRETGTDNAISATGTVPEYADDAASSRRAVRHRGNHSLIGDFAQRRSAVRVDPPGFPGGWWRYVRCLGHGRAGNDKAKVSRP